MAILCYKKLDPLPRLSSVFKNERERKQISLRDAARCLNLSLCHLGALEDGKFSRLPAAKPFRLAYVRSYAELLGLPGDICTTEFLAEGGLADIKTTHPRTALKQPQFLAWSMLGRNLVLGLGALSLVGFLVWQVKQSFEPPTLHLFAPLEGQVSSEPTAMVQGETEEESRLTINGQEVVVNSQGRFTLTLDLTEGLNTIVVEATKTKRGLGGRTVTITRHVIVKGSDKKALSKR